MASNTGLNAEIRDLYRLAPEEFTTARNALASRLGKEKRKDDAAEIKALPKPTPSAWAVNVLFERQEQKMDALIAAGKRARAAQKEAVSGRGSESLREAIRLARSLADELRWDAAQILSEHGRPPGRDLVERIAANLQAIAFSPASADQVARGWLDRDLDPPGFEVLAGLQVAASPVADFESRRPPPEPRSETQDDKDRAPGRRRKNLLRMPGPPSREEEQRREAAEQARREKEAELQRRRIAVAEEKVERARAEADPLREEADRLAAAVDEAKRAADKGREKADRAAERLAEAEVALRQLSPQQITS